MIIRRLSNRAFLFAVVSFVFLLLFTPRADAQLSCVGGRICVDLDPGTCLSRGGSPTECLPGGGGCCTTGPNAQASGGLTWDDMAQRYFGIDESRIAGTIYDLLFPIGIAIGLFAIIAAGYSFMTSQGQPDKVKEAKEKLTAAVVGVLFIVLSIVILRVIIRTLLDPSFIL